MVLQLKHNTGTTAFVPIGSMSSIGDLRESGAIGKDDWVQCGLNGLDDSSSLYDGMELQVHSRLMGGGGDGGSIPKRSDMIRTKGYTAKRQLGGMGYTPNTLVREEDQSLSLCELRALKLSTCALSQSGLILPVVIDRQGHLMSKQSLIESLLNKKTEGGEDLPVHLRHIKGLKNVREIGTDHWRLIEKSDNHMGLKGVSGSSCIQVNREGTTGGKKLWCPLKCCFIQGSVEGAFAWNCGCVFSLSGWASLESTTPTELREKVLGAMKGNEIKETCPVCRAALTAGKYGPGVLLLGFEMPESEISSIWDSKKRSTGDREQGNAKKRRVEVEESSRHTVIEEDEPEPLHVPHRRDWDQANPLSL